MRQIWNTLLSVNTRDSGTLCCLLPSSATTALLFVFPFIFTVYYSQTRRGTGPELQKVQYMNLTSDYGQNHLV